MVVKHNDLGGWHKGEFESSVISYGSKALYPKHKPILLFESSVISYGSKALMRTAPTHLMFESSVISYGSKALFHLTFP